MASPTAGSILKLGRVAAVLATAVFMNAPGLRLSAQQRTPVLVELFTSEGCSDCPPADALLSEVDAKQPIAGAQAIVLSEHVTYWNHQGWRDPFSLDAMTERQEEYVRRFGLDSSYTPQMVVDGHAQFVGSDGRALVTAVERAAQNAKVPLTIENARWAEGSAEFAVRGGAKPGAKLVAALAIDATHQEVLAGENAGRTLHHTAVVRSMKEFDSAVADGRELKLPGGSMAGKDEQHSPLRLVVFLVDRKTGHVLGAAEQTLSR